MAAVEALESPDSAMAVERMVAEFRSRRDLVVDSLNAMPGVRCARPEGAFYAFPNISATGFDERELALRLLDEAGVAVLAGSTFGPAGRGFIRVAYTQSEGDLTLGMERIADFLRRQA
jgi:aspartate/methionine/tyrosine aminotransferase